MKTFKVEFSGFAYVEAEDSDDARKLFQCDDIIYGEHTVNTIKEVAEIVLEV